MIKRVLQHIGDTNEHIYGDRRWHWEDYFSLALIVIILSAFAGFVLFMLAK